MAASMRASACFGGMFGQPVDLAAGVGQDLLRFPGRVPLLALIGGEQRLRLLGQPGGFVDAAAAIVHQKRVANIDHHRLGTRTPVRKADSSFPRPPCLCCTYDDITNAKIAMLTS